MTPLQITMLLNIHCGTPIVNQHLEPHQAALRMFERDDLVYVDLDGEPQLKLRPRGKAYVSMLMSMPLPVAHWTIPGPWSPSVL